MRHSVRDPVQVWTVLQTDMHGLIWEVKVHTDPKNPNFTLWIHRNSNQSIYFRKFSNDCSTIYEELCTVIVATKFVKVVLFRTLICHLQFVANFEEIYIASITFSVWSWSCNPETPLYVSSVMRPLPLWKGQQPDGQKGKKGGKVKWPSAALTARWSRCPEKNICSEVKWKLLRVLLFWQNFHQ